jgi:hypothetical protein
MPVDGLFGAGSPVEQWLCSFGDLLGSPHLVAWRRKIT